MLCSTCGKMPDHFAITACTCKLVKRMWTEPTRERVFHTKHWFPSVKPTSLMVSEGVIFICLLPFDLLSFLHSRWDSPSHDILPRPTSSPSLLAQPSQYVSTFCPCMLLPGGVHLRAVLGMRSWSILRKCSCHQVHFWLVLFYVYLQGLLGGKLEVQGDERLKKDMKMWVAKLCHDCWYCFNQRHKR